MEFGAAQSGATARIIRKTADEGPRPNASDLTVVGANDTHFKTAMAASDIVDGTLYLIYDGGATTDFKCTFVGPAGCEIDFSVIGARASDAAATSVGFASDLISTTGTTATGHTLGAFGTGVKVTATIRFEARNSTTPGDLQFRWAQNSSDANGPTVYRGSRMEYQKNP